MQVLTYYYFLIAGVNRVNCLKAFLELLYPHDNYILINQRRKLNVSRPRFSLTTRHF